MMENREKVLEHIRNPETQDFLNANIEKYRKGSRALTVTDASGKAIPNVRVSLIHKKHECKFGANLFMLDELETPEKNELYKTYFADVFTMATLPLYWDSTEPEKGHLRYEKGSTPLYRRPPIDLCMEFCEKHGIEPREHALAYDHFFPKWIWNADTETVKEELERRYREISTRYRDRIHTIEVTNEMNWEEGRTAFYSDPEFIKWCFDKAAKYFPHNQLVVNDAVNESWLDRGRSTDKYYAYIENTLLKGGRIDAIGMQFHAWTSSDMIESEYARTNKMLYNPMAIYERLNLYASFGKPLQITEITLSAAGSEPENEQIQAELLEGLYSTWFAHPNVEQIIYWNLVDGYAYVDSDDPEIIGKSQGDMTLGENRFYGGLLRFDMTPKPAYETLKNLIQKKWHTEVEEKTDLCGQIKFYGFWGEYDVEIITPDGKHVYKQLHYSSKENEAITIVI